MIKFEYNMLVLNNAFSDEDVQQINAYAEYVRSQERERIIALLEDENCNIRISCTDEVVALIKGENE